MLQAVLHSISVGDMTATEKNFKIVKSKDSEETRADGEKDDDDLDQKEQEALVVEKEVGEGVVSGGEECSARVRGLKCSSIEEYAAAVADALQGG